MSDQRADYPLAGRTQQYDISGLHDPRIQATLAPKGSTFRRVGENGGTFFIKQDDGTTTNWLIMFMGSGAPSALGVQGFILEDTGLVFTPI